ncbi:MAG: S8 family serine peptidase [Chloroflexi bacterium]|nr:S8 family serine peptidase [Chloroflexota bacterium]
MQPARVLRGGAALLALALFLMATATPAPLAATAQPPAAPSVSKSVRPPTPPVSLAGIPSPDMSPIPLQQSSRRPHLESAVDQFLTGYSVQQSGASRAESLGLMLEGDRLRLIVDAEAGTEQRVREQAAALGAEVESVYGSWLQVLVHPANVTSLSELSGVNMVRRPIEFRPQGTPVKSQAIAYSGADKWHAAGFRGQGTKIAVVDLGFQGYQDLLGRELPANVRTKSFARGGAIEGTSEHGAACAEIVYGMAPEATLYLVNFTTEVDLGNAIDWMVDEGITIVSFSLGHTSGPLNGTHPTDSIINNANARGILWVNAAGNSGARHWHGDFANGKDDDWVEFAPGVKLNPITVEAGEPVLAILTWDDWPLSKEDYGLYLFLEVFDKQLNMVSFADTLHTGKEAPQQVLVAFGAPRGKYYLGVKRLKATKPMHFHLWSMVQDLGIKRTDMSIVIPAAATGAFAVGATNDGKDTIEEFSSRGPTADGRMKPDMTAPDRVDTAIYGAEGFEGTSASAPHVAGAAAVIRSAYPWLTTEQVQNYLKNNALDLGDPWADNVFGAGRLQLPAAPGDVPPVPTFTPAPPPSPTMEPTPRPTRTPVRTPTVGPTATPTAAPTSPAWAT